ncbi:rhomboid family intramembrane serine protease [Dactylosporangium sp. NPDC051541]|uniref:rhomboid family intramembrane serine protease n=1 Tax=Dactylosporangium sp. NPDC051541 TaxID=3363977 RepID=UPI00379482FA
MNALLTGLYLVLLITAGRAGSGLRGPRRHPPIATCALFAAVATFSFLQLLAAPALFTALRRDRAAIADGQVWRLLTSTVVQDGGWPGTIFNLIALAVLGILAERLWGTRHWLALALVVQVLGSLWGLVVQPVGAGTSLVDFGLAGALATTAALATRHPLGFVALAAGLALLLLGDIHGGAALSGALFAVAAHRIQVRRSQAQVK